MQRQNPYQPVASKKKNSYLPDISRNFGRGQNWSPFGSQYSLSSKKCQQKIIILNYSKFIHQFLK